MSSGQRAELSLPVIPEERELFLSLDRRFIEEMRWPQTPCPAGINLLQGAAATFGETLSAVLLGLRIHEGRNHSKGFVLL